VCTVGSVARCSPTTRGPSYAGYTVWRGIVAAQDAARIGVDQILSETWGRAARFGIAAINDGQVYWFGCESAPENANPAGVRLRDNLVRALPTALFSRFAAGAFSWTPPPMSAGSRL